MSGPALADTWVGEGVTLDEVEAHLAELRESSTAEGAAPNLRTSVMSHVAWVPLDWLETARATLQGMAEAHPSRTLLLVPDADAGEDRLDASISIQCYALPGIERQVCSEIVELRLLGPRAKAPASVAAPLLVADLPVFCRWRGEPAFGSPELDQLVALTDRLIFDSTEWDDLPYAYTKLPPLFSRTAVSDIAWARTGRWRALLASLWPGIADVRTIRVRSTAAQAYLVAGWLRSRLGQEIALEHVPAERLEGIDLDGDPAPFPPGDRPDPSDLLSDELDTFERDPVYEAAVASAADQRG